MQFRSAAASEPLGWFPIVPMSAPANGVSWLHRLATLAAVLALFLVVLGALVTAANPAMLTPRWPTLLDHLWQSHAPGPAYQADYGRMAVAVSLVTLVLALWLSRSVARAYVKMLGWAAVLCLLAVSFVDSGEFFPAQTAARAIAHAMAAETFFCVMVCLALFSRTDWRWDEPKTHDVAAPAFRWLSVFATGALFVEAILGAAIRSLGLAPHLILGMADVACVLWMLEIALNKFASLAAMKIAMIILAEVVGLELFLGLVTYSMGLDALKTGQALPGVVIMTATHAAVGALSLAASLFVTFQAFRYLEPPG